MIDLVDLQYAAQLFPHHEVNIIVGYCFLDLEIDSSQMIGMCFRFHAFDQRLASSMPALHASGVRP